MCQETSRWYSPWTISADNERLVRYRRARRSVELAPDAFFFQEGHAAHYEDARYGVFRYLFLVHIEGKGGSPTEIVLKDRGVQAIVLLYGVYRLFRPGVS